MARTNTKSSKTYEVKRTAGGAGAVASNITKHAELERLVLTCMLWENNAYADGVEIATRIAELCKTVAPATIADLAVRARTDMHLRHIPLFLCVQLARRGELKAQTLTDVIQRADEMAEFLSLYWKDGKCPISNQVKLGLRNAVGKFNEYNFAKYLGSNKEVKLRDVLLLTHPKPINAAQSKLYKSILDGTIESPDTWEVQLSTGANKKDTFTRLINDKKLGALAFLKSLRGMIEAGVSDEVIRSGLRSMNTARILPFNFITAARYGSRFEADLEDKMLSSFTDGTKLKGKTVIVIDVSGSMGAKLSAGSELTRLDTAKAICIIAREMCDDVQIYCTAGESNERHKTELIPARRGFALSARVQQAYNDLGKNGIFLKQCLDYIDTQERNVDRLIIITDEQDVDRKANPKDAKALGAKHNYIMNIASHQNGIGYGKFTHITGFSDKIFNYIQEFEKSV